MALTVDFYNVAKRRNSTFVPADDVILKTEKAILKSGCGVLSPTLILNFSVTSKPHTYNYVRIRELNRFYWVKEWSVADGVGNWECYLDVDVLASYKEKIESSNFYITRTSVASDGDIIDTMMATKPMLHRYRVVGDYLWQPSESGFKGGCFVVGVVGRDGVTQFYKMGYGQFINFADAMFKNCDWLKTEGASSKLAQFGDDVIKTIINPAQYITSVMWFPSGTLVPSGQDMQGINLGWWGIPLSSGLSKIDDVKLVTVINASVTPTAHPDEAYGNYLNSYPYRKICLYIPCFGSFWLDSSKIKSGASVDCVVQVDFRTGMAFVEVSTKTADGTKFILDTRYSQVGVSVQVSDMKTNLVGALSSALGASTSMLTGNPLGVVAGIGNAMSQGVIPDINTSGNFGTTCNISSTLVAMVYSARIIGNFNNAKGKPYCKWGNMHNLGNGYYQVLNGDIPIEHAYESEIQDIKNFLESGVWVF